MLRKYITAALVLACSTTAFAQVGIGTTAPHASSDLELGSNNKALYLNRVANTAAVANPQPGMVIYDLESKCVKAYQSNPPAWSGCLTGNPGSGTGTVTALNCASALFVPPSGTVGQEYSGTLTIPYSGGNGGTYTTTHFTVNGLTFFLPAGSFATGSGSLVYQVIGTPTAAGNTAVEITIGGQSCSGANALSLTVNPAPSNPTGVLPSNITLVQNRKHFIASIYDTDYLPYTAPTGPATTAVMAADGSPDTTIDIKGTITTAGITVQIPVASVTGTGNIAAWSNIITIPANMTQDNTPRQVELSWAAQAYTGATRYVTATIKTVSGTLNVKQLDLNAGLGADYLGVLMGTFQYPYNSTGTLTSYELRDMPGIPDRMFGKTDNTPATGQRHNFLYMPVMAEDGKVWLSNNLGADYTKIGHAAFGLNKQATGINDFNAYGSLFQWGRKPDGHEIVTWTNATTATLSGTTSTKEDNPNHSLHITAGSPYDWRINPDDLLWTNESGANNPCPHGFKVPSITDEAAWQLSSGINPLNINTTQSINTLLKKPLVRSRNVGLNADNSSYWTGTAIPPATSIAALQAYSTMYRTTSAQSYDSPNYRYYGIVVRCIQN